MKLPSHIPHGAQNKTDYVRGYGIKRSEWYVFDGKVYSSNPQSVWNGSNWHEFCERMKN